MKSVGYYAICDLDQSSGVYKKVSGFVAAANSLGYIARCTLIKGGRGSHFSLLKNVGFAKEDIVVVRGNSYAFFLLMIGMFLARMRGRKIVLDVATPMAVVFREVIDSCDSVTSKFGKVLGFCFSGPWSFWAANRIIQYAPEGKWFSLGAYNKTILLGNGIDTHSIPIRGQQPPWPASELWLIGVAQVANWHGYDLIIKAVAKYNKLQDRKYKIFFTIIGNGKELEALKILSKKLQVEDQIVFTGPLQGEDLYSRYDLAHIAVGSIGLHRKGLAFASELKAREYCAIGIPFLSSGIDPDFPSDVSFRYVIESTEDINTIVSFFVDLEHKKLVPPHIIRGYAEENLDFNKKVKLILNI